MHYFKLPEKYLASCKDLKQQVCFKRKLKKNTPVLIYQMGKVGSTSVYKSLLRYYPGVVIHTHGFSEDYDHRDTRVVYDWAMVQGKELKVISLVREPVSRNISAFFQNFERYVGIPFEGSNFSIEELKEIFLKNHAYETPLHWFDVHIKEKFQIDVYSSPFPEDGVGEYRNGNINVLVIRLESNDKVIVQAIQKFLGLSTFEILHENVGNQKIYSKSYTEFKEQVRLPESYLSTMYESKYFKHFYSKEFAESAIKRWKSV